MKKLIKINFLLIIAAVLFCNIASAQQKASDKSYATVVNEVKQKQAMRNKMLQQVQKSTPVNTVTPNNNKPEQPVNINGAVPVQQTTSVPIEPKQTTTNKPLNQPAKLPVRSKNQ